jgi:superkiller protein 3
MELSDKAGEGVRSYAAAQTGHIYLALGSSADAIEAYDKALSDVDHLAALFGSASAHVYYAKGALRWGAPGRAAVSLEAAKNAAKRAVDIMGDSTTATVWKLLGDIHYLAAQVNDPALGKDFTSMVAARMTEACSAVDAYERALKLKHDRPGRWRDIVAALRLQTEIYELSGDVAAANASKAKAWESATGYLRAAPGDPFAWLAAAAIDDPTETSDDVRMERKITALSRAVALNPTFAEAWCALGRLYLSSSNIGEATLSLDSARIADPSSGDAWTATAALHIATGKLDEGRGAFRMAATLGAGAEADLGCALTACASGLTHAKDAYAAARRARETLPADPMAAIALALCAECRGLFEEAEDAAAHATACLANSTALGGDPRVIHAVAEECRARLSQRRSNNMDKAASTIVVGDFEDTLERAKLLTHARPEDLKMRDAFTRVASCAPDHQTVISALFECPSSLPNGDYRIQSSLARAAAACALNASTVVGDVEGSTRADRLVARATMLDPSSTESIELLKIVLDRRNGIIREAEVAQSNAHELYTALKSTLTQRDAGDSAAAEAAARAVVKRENITDAAQAGARLILASLLIERSHRDGDAKAAKEAVKVLAKIPSEAGVADLAAALADAVSG